MYVCMYVWMYAVCMYVRVDVFLYMYTFSLMYRSLGVRLSVYACDVIGCAYMRLVTCHAFVRVYVWVCYHVVWVTQLS